MVALALLLKKWGRHGSACWRFPESLANCARPGEPGRGAAGPSPHLVAAHRLGGLVAVGGELDESLAGAGSRGVGATRVGPRGQRPGLVAHFSRRLWLSWVRHHCQLLVATGGG